MDTKKIVQEKIDELDSNFDRLTLNNELNINTIETVAMNNIKEYKQIINKHIEELIFQKINEKELITKKNKSGED